MKNSNKLILVTIILIIIIISISILLIILIKNIQGRGSDEYENIQLEQIDSYIANKNIEKVTNRNKYFAIDKIINSYFSYTGKINEEIHLSYEVTPEERKQIQQEVQKEAIKVIKQMCEEYYEGKSDNLIIKDSEIYNKEIFKIKDMYISEKNSKINIYFVELESENLKNNIVIKTDSANMTFNIYPNSFVEQYKNNKEEIINKISDSQIEKKEYNYYKYVNITDEYMSKLYFDDYINKLSVDTKLAYTLLENEYATKRFINYEDFYNYSQAIVKEEVEIKEYMLNQDKGHNEYVFKDQYGNFYIFKENAIMDYSVTLDTYTLEQEKFIEEYEKSTNQRKVMMNINKFFQMINAKDYNAAYKLLDNNFKNNYFRTVDIFENYMKQRVFLYNDVEYVNYNGDISGVFTYTLNLKNRLDNTQEIEFSIVMQLKEGTDFVMSFPVY